MCQKSPKRRKVGDTLIATVVDRNGEDVSDAVSYQWYADDVAIEGATDETLVVTVAMVGSTIKVVATAENGNTFESDETEEVGVYEALEILSAEQTAQYTAEVTFSAPISNDDKLEVTKGGNKVEFKSAIDSDKLGAELTFTDALTDGEYTVTLTPADKDVDPSSVTFEGQKTVLYEIVFLSKELVMKDHYYNEGYAYIEGRDQWGKKKNLSGINVVSGVGTFKSYDSDTGKITIKDDTKADNQTGAFLTIKEVPVFVQYQEGSTVISANETLTVSTRAYVDDLTFGEVKKNSTEQAKRLTLDELSSGLYYVEILDAKDQYGNALSADDLQDQTDKTNPVLFVIPGDSGAFYTTGKFTELNGKTVLWLEDNDGKAKPGKMDLKITGAGGKTFTKEGIEIFDNPYIDELTVDYPDLYEGMTESKKLNFSAVDQYVDDVNLWDFRPSLGKKANGDVDNTKLVFGDVNGMTGVSTEISVSGGAFFNVVETDTKAKEFKVTVNVGAMEAKQMAVFTITTAGTKVKTKTITIGERGKAAKVASSFPSTKKLDPGKDWNVNADVAFVDINGNKMTRNKNNKDYPYFLNGNVAFAAATNGKADNISETALPNNAVIDHYVWTLSENKVTNAADAIAATAKYDVNGKINGKIDDTDNAEYDITVNAAAPKDVYVTVYAYYGGKYYIVDSASTRVSMINGFVEKVEVVAPGKLYAAENSTDDETFKVKLTNKVGESWKVNASSIVVGGIFTGLDNGATLSGKLASDLPGDTTKTTPVSVYFDAQGDWEGGLVGTVDLTYTNVTPVPTTTKFKFTADEIGQNGAEIGRVGAKIDGDLTDTEFKATSGATYSVDATGKLTIEDFNELKDDLEAYVVDQYDQPISGTVVYLNGKEVTDKMPVDDKRNVWEFKNDNQGKVFYVTETKATTVSVATPVTAEVEVSTKKELMDALKNAKASASADTIVVTDDIALTADIEVAENDTLVIPYLVELDVTGTVTNNGTIRGEEEFGANDETTAGTLKINGTLATKAGITGQIDLPGSSLELDGAAVTGSLNIIGHIVVGGNVTFDEDSDIAIKKDSVITMDAGSALNILGDFQILNDFEAGSAAATDSIAVKDSTGNTLATLTAEAVNPGYAKEATPETLTIDDTDGVGVTLPADKETGEITISSDKTVGAGITLTVEENQTLTVEEGQTLTVEGTLVNNGTIKNDGTITNNGTITNEGTITNNGTFEINGSYEGNPVVGNLVTIQGEDVASAVAPMSAEQAKEEGARSVKDKGEDWYAAYQSIMGDTYTKTVTKGTDIKTDGNTTTITTTFDITKLTITTAGNKYWTDGREVFIFNPVFVIKDGLTRISEGYIGETKHTAAEENWWPWAWSPSDDDNSDMFWKQGSIQDTTLKGMEGTYEWKFVSKAGKTIIYKFILSTDAD